MPLAAILGICLLVSWPPQPSQPGSTSQQDVSTPPPMGQKAAQQPAKTQPTPTPAAQPCAENLQAGSNTKSDCKTSGTKTRKHPRKTDAPAATPAGTAPTKKVVRDGGTSEPTVDLAPGVNPQQASNRKESTNQLLATSDANLRKVAGRQLSSNQQDTVKQIQSY